MEQVQKQVVETIVAEKDAISIDVTPTAEEKFCEVWPQVQVGLELLQNIIKNPIVKFVITIIFGAGNAVAASMCEEEKVV